MRLSQLEVGETGIVKEFTDLEMSVKLMEMGCLPGEADDVFRALLLWRPDCYPCIRLPVKFAQKRSLNYYSAVIL